jgi:hypothetical protein
MSITHIQDSTAKASTKAILIRGVEKRLLDLFSEGKLFGTVHTCIGQEWTGIAVVPPASPPKRSRLIPATLVLLNLIVLGLAATALY